MLDDDQENETYILLLLSDSNLPTGSFVASSGLESYIKHGFASSESGDPPTLTFLQDSLTSYARSALPFVSDAHRIVSGLIAEEVLRDNVLLEGKIEQTLRSFAQLDELYHSLTLNHVARRASKSQGVALLTLYSKGFSRSSSLSTFPGAELQSREMCMMKLFDRLKFEVRRSTVHGHLPTCWGALTAALRLSIDRAQFLHLFLHARSLLSASVRLNDLGPYNAQQILLHAVRPLVAVEASKCRHLRTGLIDTTTIEFDEITQGPANTWPLGEILATRHDLQHSRIFNS